MAGAGGRRRRGPRPGRRRDPSALAFAEAVFGVRSRSTSACPPPARPAVARERPRGPSPSRCTECQGAGEVRRVRQSLLGQIVTSVACSRCGGTGNTIPNPCSECRGEGRRMEERTLTVDVPAGVDDGSTLRLAEHGAAGLRGGPNGRLRARRRRRRPGLRALGRRSAHTTFRDRGQASLGTEALRDPRRHAGRGRRPGHPERHVLQVQGHGVPHLRGRGRGDLFVHLQVETPTDLSPSRSCSCGTRRRGARRSRHRAPGAATACSRGCAPPLGAHPRLRRHPRVVRAAAQVFVDDPSAPVLDDEDVHHLGRRAAPPDEGDGRRLRRRGHWTLCRFRGAQRSRSGRGRRRGRRRRLPKPAPSRRSPSRSRR